MAAFKLNAQDLKFVLEQIKIAEANAAGIPLKEIYVDAQGNWFDPITGLPYTVASLGVVQAISTDLVPKGLRNVDGTDNNLTPGREHWGSSGSIMPRALDAVYTNDADGDRMPLGPPGSGAPTITNTDYGLAASVADADPRIISNLIVDQTVNNPAAIVAWLNNPIALAAWQEANPGMTPVAPGAVTDPLTQLEITNTDLAFLPNIAPDEGLSASFNAWMTFFGQFFDHGLDLTTKGGSGSVYIPLMADDPLVTRGPDGIAGTGDEVPASQQFMVLTRATDMNGAAPGNESRNMTTSWVDQNQTYSSHPSHQVFLREYATVNGKTVATGHLFDGVTVVNGVDTYGLPTWAEIKANALEFLGIELVDHDVLNIPLIRTDGYGRFIADPVTGYAQVVVGLGADGVPNTSDDIVVSGTPDSPVRTFQPFIVDGVQFAGAVRIGHAFLDDIADAAAPTTYDHDGNPATAKISAAADADTVITEGDQPRNSQGQKTTYDNELLAAHYVTGDGRGNENIGLTAVHHVFHAEHNRQVEQQKLTILASRELDFINEWLAVDLASLAGAPGANASLAQLKAFADTLTWDGERLFQSAKMATEMQYQHLVFEEFGRKIQPMIDPFVFNAVTDIDPTIFAEFAHTVYRFGHSMLTENLPRINGAGEAFDITTDLVKAFLNPVSFQHVGGDPADDLTADEAAASIVRGMTIETGNAIDEFVINGLRNNLLGLPLDLAALNIARGRETGVPSLNLARAQLYEATSSTFLKPYANWIEFTQNLKTPASAVNFLAAYGKHPTILAATTLEEKRDAAMLLMLGNADVNGDGIAETAPADRIDFLASRGGVWTAQTSGLNDIDLWIGGLAEKTMPFGGMLGSTFNAIFEAQMENLQDGDRFYYLTRTQGQNFLVALEQNSFAKMIMANTNLAQPGPDGVRGTADDIIDRHIGVDTFATYEYVLEVNAANQNDYNGAEAGVDPTTDDPFLLSIGQNKVSRDNIVSDAVETRYLKFVGGEHIVVGGTNFRDHIITDAGDDGIWGDAGNDRIESGAGVDLVNGGSGDDIISDSGDTGDFLKGDEGNDVISNSNGNDVMMGGEGKDAIFIGVDSSEVFAGEGDDFVLGGQGQDLIMGNEGDDWLEGGDGFDTTAGDNSELFFDSKIIGHDVMFAGSEEHDFDAESGDDIMVQGESVMRNEGMWGFDWAIYKGINHGIEADMTIAVFATEALNTLRDRFDSTEGVSGWDYDDILIGDDRVYDAALQTAGPGATAATGEGVFFMDGLDQEGVRRIAGLDPIIPRLGADGYFNGANILLGGGGSDLIWGRGGDDILDGDRWLNVRIRITNTPNQNNNAGNEVATVDKLTHVFSGMVGEQASWNGQSLYQLMVDGVINPGRLHIVREIITDDGVGDIDTAKFWDVRANYTITQNGNGSWQVSHTGFDPANVPLGQKLFSDGIDTLFNIEQAQFADQLFSFIPVAATGAPVILGAPVEDEAVTIDTTSIADANTVGAFSYQWQASDDGLTWTTIAGATAATFTPTDLLLNGFANPTSVQLRVTVSFTDELGTLEALTSEASANVVTVNDGTAEVTVVGPVAGTFNVGDTFTASVSADPDDINQPAAIPSFQWLRDGIAIDGATSADYTLQAADASTAVTVSATYTDAQGFLEAPEAFIGGLVQAPATGLPTITITNANNGATVNSAERRVFTAVTSGIADGNGISGDIAVQWQASGDDGATWSDVVDATASTFIPEDAFLNSFASGALVRLRVVASFADGLGAQETLVSTQTGRVVRFNDGAATVTISGSAAVGQTLTGTVGPDPDGAGAVAPVLQWLRDGVAIDGATTSTYKLVEADTGAAISLRASYTDYQGFVEAPVSAATAAVIGQVAATGAPVISDTTPTEGQTLVLDTASIADANGLGAFALKWQASSDGQTWQDIAGQTTAAYSPQDALFASFARGAAVQLRAVASFTDGAGNAETVASAATAAVLAVNDGTAAVTIAGAATVGQTLSASLTADPDGNGTTPQYQWLRNGLAIDGATASNYVLAAADGNQQISVRASYTDHQGFAEAPVSAATVRIQAPVTGAPVIADTTPTEGSLLTINTASIADGNGLGVFAYQWQSSANGTTWSNIAGATAATFTPQDLAGITAGAQAGQFLRISVSFTDGAGVRETVVSAATSVTGRNWQSASNTASAFAGTAGDDIALGRGGADSLAGNAGNDTIIGAGGNDVITGGDGNDTLGNAANEAGNDTFTGGAGDDVINGGAGTDIASYVTAMTAASFSNTGTSIVVNAGAEGQDTVSLVETLRFNNVAYTVASGTAANNTLTGAAGSQILFGFEGIDTINGGAGNDVIVAGDGNDFIVQAAATGNRDIVDGGAGTDTFTLTGDATAESFRIYTRTEALALGLTGLHANTEIVVTRNGTTNASIIAELDNVEEIVINTTNTTANDANGVVNSGTFAGDTIAVFGDFRQTSLDYSTITITGSKANDTVDISGLQSDHRVVFASNGGTDTILGQARAQDVFGGQSLNDLRTGVAALASTVGETSAASSQLPAFGSSDGLGALLAGQSRQALRDMVSDHAAANRKSHHRMEANAHDEQYLTELRLQPDRSSSSHDFGRTMVENADHDVRPLDLAQKVNLAVAPEAKLNDMALDLRHLSLSQYDLVPC